MQGGICVHALMKHVRKHSITYFGPVISSDAVTLKGNLI